MKEMRDPEIRLFGRKIVLPESGGGGETSAESSGSGVEYDRSLESSGGELPQAEEVQVSELCNTKEPNPGGVEESQNPNKSDSSENPRTPSTDEDGMSENETKAENEQSGSPNGQQKALKKPDKVLPCPRCNSMDTKFCYYNNYNVNQPRHFCKSCQRYWTAGGTMRNVPVGAGRRRNKNSASHCRHITISDALQSARIDTPNGLHHPVFMPNGTALSFGCASSLCDSVVSGLSLPDKQVPNGIGNGHHEVDHDDSVPCKNGDECSIESSVITTNSSVDGSKIAAQQPVMQTMNAFTSSVPCLPRAPWPLPWNSALAMPAIYPIPFCLAPYWNCSLPNAWNAPWPSMLSPTANQKPTISNPNWPLGKHARNGELLKPNCSESNEEQTEMKNSGNSIVVPKTLRINDPQEAAKSSIWETLGIKYDSIHREVLFKALQPKGEQKKPTMSPSLAFQANPAALSRSISFQEQQA